MDPLAPPASEFMVGWISALPVELTAATAMLDKTYKSLGSTAQYTLGRMHHHNVVLACLPAGQIGTNAAATVAAQMKSKFPNLEIGLMVGVGAGVPSVGADIRLGDVVISQPHGTYGGVVQYDFGKTGPSGYSLRTGFLNAPPAILLTAVSKLRSNLSLGKSGIPKHLSSLAERAEFNPSNAGPDILYRASYTHIESPTSDCCDCCARDMLVSRIPRDREEVVIHYGTIASGNQVMKDGSTRDTISAKLGGVLCFEMEAAGLMNTIPSLVIRGICDYADTHKNKTWQPFAAAAAAACAKEILLFVPSKRNEDSRHTTGAKVVDPSLPKAAPRLHARLALDASERQQYLENLKFEHIDARHATIKTAHADTCKWLLKRSEYQDWLNVKKIPNHGGFLWIKGKPGSGKSTMMKFAYSDAKRRMAETTFLSFFFNARGEELEKTTIGMYRSLLCQLLDRHPELQVVLDPLASRYTMSYMYEIETVESLFRHAIEHFGPRSLTCFIDAVDECNEDQVREMITFLEQLASLGAHYHFRFRVCFSSRHYPHITVRKGIELILEGQKEHDQDIAYYLHSELRVDSTPFTEQIKAEILERASGIFLWVALVVKILNKEYDRGHTHALRRRLDQIPNGLDELFRDTLIRDGENIEELIICIQWVLFAARPLNPEELYFAIMAVAEPEELARWNPEDVTAKDMERYILSSSKGLVEFTKSNTPTVQFIHESVRDYLLSGNGLEWLRSDLVGNFPGLSHERLKQCSENFVRTAISECLSLNTFIPPASKYTLLGYAVQHVLYHADAASGHGVSQLNFVENFPFEEWRRRFFEKHTYAFLRGESTPNLLYTLAERNLPNLIQLELQRVPHMDISEGYYVYPIFRAIILANEKAVRALLTPTTSLKSEPGKHGTQFEAVASSVIRNRKGYSLETERTLLLQAAISGDAALVKALIETGKVNLNSRNKFGQTVLSCAAEKGHEKVVQLLLSAGHKPTHAQFDDQNKPLELNARDKYGRTPLFWAVLSRSEQVLKLLLDCPEVDVASADNEGEMPLHLAVVWGYAATVKTLLAHPRVRVDVQDKLGRTPLSVAAKKGNVAVAELLLTRADINVNSQDVIGRTPLCLAAKEGHYSMVELLLEHPEVEAGRVDAFGRTPLSYGVGPGLAELLGKHSTGPKTKSFPFTIWQQP